MIKWGGGGVFIKEGSSVNYVLAICQNSQEPSFCEVIYSSILVAYAKSDLFCWYKQKMWFLWNMAAAQAAEKPRGWVRFDLILTMKDIYITSLKTLTEFTSSSTSTKFKDNLPWNICQMIKRLFQSAQQES